VRVPSAEARSPVTLAIPRPLYEQLGQAIDGTGFRSATEFAVYLLRDLIASERAEAAGAPAEQLSREELDALRRRLQALGYLE
jgi:Arc/MetJ-type ribon-helix-helix transcriptional regulator